MGKTNSLTYLERKKSSKKGIFNKTLIGMLGLTLALTIGNLIVNPSRITNLKKTTSNYLEKKVDELNRNDYLKLRKYVIGEELINPIPEQGWRYYTERLFEGCLKANKIGSFNEWTNFFKIYNGGENPTIGKKIRFPKIDCK